MACYVDDVRFPFRGMVMCHLWADTPEELHAFAARLGLRRDWFQRPPKASWPHYDVSLSKKADAIRLGAIRTDRYGALEFNARRAGNAVLLARIARCRAAKQGKTT